MRETAARSSAAVEAAESFNISARFLSLLFTGFEALRKFRMRNID